MHSSPGIAGFPAPPLPGRRRGLPFWLSYNRCQELAAARRGERPGMGLFLRWLKRTVEDRSSMVAEYLFLMKTVYGFDDAMLAETGVN